MNNLFLYVINDADLYAMYADLCGACRKRVSRSKPVEMTHLAECSSMKKIICSACKYAAKFGELYSSEVRKQARYMLAERIINEINEE